MPTKHHKIFIATPAFGHQAFIAYVNGLIKFMSTPVPEDLSYETVVHLHAGSANISHARNNCVRAFLKSDCTKMLFIDADIGFAPENIHNLLRKDEDVMMAPYLAKSVQGVEGGRFIIHFPEKRPIEVDEDGFTKIDAGPAGFLMIDRSAFTKIMEKFPDKEVPLKQVLSDKFIELKDFYTFFDCITTKEHGAMGEDISFCHLWKSTGGEIYCDTRAVLIHCGITHFTSSLKRTIEASNAQ